MCTHWGLYVRYEYVLLVLSKRDLQLCFLIDMA